MDFHKLSLPHPKKFSADCTLKEFPIDRIPEIDNDRQFTGFFNGLSVEIIDPDAIRQLYSNGCFGLSSKTKNVPQLLHNFPRVQNVTQSQYEQKTAWNAKYTNQNPNLVMMNLLIPTGEKSAQNTENSQIDAEIETIEDIAVDNNTEETHIDDVQNDEENIVEEDQPMASVQVTKHQIKSRVFKRKTEQVMNLVVDPFPIEDALALSPEEAFFLHFSLRCLKIMDFDQTHEFTTEEALKRFCTMNPKFIERFIAYHFYRSKNWVVRSGLKFGGDFRKKLFNKHNIFLIKNRLIITVM